MKNEKWKMENGKPNSLFSFGGTVVVVVVVKSLTATRI